MLHVVLVVCAIIVASTPGGDGDWEALFNGKDLDAFGKPTRDGKWEVRDGVIVGSGGKGVLATRETFDNFILVADVRISDTADGRGNSGLFIHSTGLLAQRGRWPDGMEIQVDHGDPTFWTGSIWKKAPAKKVDTKDGEWCVVKIEAAGPRIRVWVNGTLVTEHVEPGPIHRGPISLQVHHPSDVVEFRNLRVRRLRSA